MAKRAETDSRRAGKSQTMKAMLRRALTGSAMGLALIGMPMAATAENLGQALADAYNNSGLLEKNRAVLKAADEDGAQALARLRPVLSWSAGLSHSYGRTDTGRPPSVVTESNGASATLTMSLLLFDFGATRLSLDVAKETVLLTRQQLVSIEQQILLRAVTAYMEVRRATENVALRQANVGLLTQELRASRDRFDVGEVTRTDVSQAEAALAASRSGLTSANGALIQARLEYEAAVGHTPGTLAPPSRLGSVPDSEQAAIAIALQNHPSMNVARRQVTIAELQIAATDASLKPSLNLSGSYGLESDLDSEAHGRKGSVSLGLSGPIYSGGALASQQRQAMLNKEQTLANLHVVSQDIRQAVGNGFSGVRIAQAATIAGNEQVSAAKVAFEGVREEATLGSRTTLDVLTQEQSLLDARTTYLSAQVDEVLARYELLSAMGLLTAQDLKLNVDIYDPAAYYNMVKNAPIGISKQGRQLDSVLRRIGKN